MPKYNDERKELIMNDETRNLIAEAEADAKTCMNSLRANLSKIELAVKYAFDEANKPEPEKMYNVVETAGKPYQYMSDGDRDSPTPDPVIMRKAMERYRLRKPHFRHSLHILPSHIDPNEARFRARSAEGGWLECDYPGGGCGRLRTTYGPSNLTLHAASCILRDALAEYPDAYIEHVKDGTVTKLPRVAEGE